LKIGGSGAQKYAVLTIERNGNHVLYSKGFGANNVFGRDDQENDEFKLVRGQTLRTSFDKVFLFRSVSFAVDRSGLLWVLGGKLAVQDQKIFPMDMSDSFFRQPTKSALHFALMEILALPETTKVAVKDLSYTEKVILITVQLVTLEESPPEEVVITLSDDGNG